MARDPRSEYPDDHEHGPVRRGRDRLPEPADRFALPGARSARPSGGQSVSVIQMNVHHGFWARLRRLPRGWIGAALVALVVLGAVFAPQIAPAAPTFQFRDGLAVDGTPLPPSGQFMLGTDNLGRDV